MSVRRSAPLPSVFSRKKKNNENWSRTEAVWSHITRTKRIGVGKSLPSERDIAHALKINRLHVRDALSTLQQLGLIERRPRAGSFRREVDVAFLVPYIKFFLSDSVIGTKSDIFRELRYCIESRALEEAFKNRTAEDLIQLETAIVCQQESKGDLEKWIEYDQKFHVVLVDASHSESLRTIGSIAITCFSSVAISQTACTAYADDILSDHWKILQSLSRRNKKVGASVLKTHLLCPHELRKK